MTIHCLRLERDSATTGAFEWAILDDRGALLEAGISSPGLAPFTGPCRLVLASDLVLLDRVAAPAAQQRSLSGALRFLAEGSAIPDPDQLHVVAAPAPLADCLDLAIVDRHWLERMLQTLARGGLLAVSACPECLLPELLPRTWTVVWNGRSSFARTGPAEGFSLDSPSDDEPPVALRLALDKARSASSAPDAIVLRTAPGIAQPDRARWAAQLGVAVDPGPEWRWADARAQPGIELLQGEFAPHAAESGWTRRLRRPAMLAVTLILVFTLGIAIDWAAKAAERRTLLAKMEAAYRASFGATAVVLDPGLQMRRAIDGLRRQTGQPMSDDFLVLLGSVADLLLDPQRHKIEEINYENGTLAISMMPASGPPQDPGQFNRALEELRAKASVHGLDIRIEPTSAGGRTSLRLTATPRTGK